jgi:DNA ligase 1
MDFIKLVEVYEKLESISSGNEMREVLAKFFKQVPTDDIAMLSYLTLGKLGADFESHVLGLAEKSVLKSIALAGGTGLDTVKKVLRETGDAGLAAQKVLKTKPQTLVPLGKLTVHELFEKLKLISQTAGMGSIETKTKTIATLLQKTSSTGAKYVVRIALGTLRMGVAEMTILDSLAIAFTGEKKNKEMLERAYNICPDVGVIADIIATKGLEGLEKINITVGRPIRMMLAQRVKEWDDVVKKIPGKLAAEGKYDGERVQAHKVDNKITLFSRRLENISEQFPDLVGNLAKQVNAKEFIIEAEILAIDEEGKHLPFQTLMQRRRKYDVEEYMKRIPVQAKVFDLLFVDGEEYIDKPYAERTENLRKIVKENRHVTNSDQIITDDLKEVKKFFTEMLKDKQEGIMIKSLEGEYQAGTRGWNWIKWKKDYSADISDTLDLVIVGAFYGRGRRVGAYGALLCAVYNTTEDRFETVCKLGTGLNDEMLKELPKKLKKFISEKQPARVECGKEMIPDVWFTPSIVVEVLGAEITKSPFHTVGYAVRFPRFLQFRDNKEAEQATTSKEVKEMA